MRGVIVKLETVTGELELSSLQESIYEYLQQQLREYTCQYDKDVAQLHIMSNNSDFLCQIHAKLLNGQWYLVPIFTGTHPKVSERATLRIVKLLEVFNRFYFRRSLKKALKESHITIYNYTDV